MYVRGKASFIRLSLSLSFSLSCCCVPINTNAPDRDFDGGGARKNASGHWRLLYKTEKWENEIAATKPEELKEHFFHGVIFIFQIAILLQPFISLFLSLSLSSDDDDDI